MPSLDGLLVRILLVVALLLAGASVAGRLGPAQGNVTNANEPVRWVIVPVFPNSPTVVALSRSGYSLKDVYYEVVLAPPELFDAVHRPDEIMMTGAYLNVVFLLIEYHYHDGLHQTYGGTMTIDGTRYSRPVLQQLSDDGHSRITALIFPDLPLSMLDEPHTFEIPLPPDEAGNHQIMTWETPIELPTQTAG